MSRYFFLLGRTQDLAWLELQTVLKRFLLSNPTKVLQGATIEANELKVDQILLQVGGVVKIYRQQTESLGFEELGQFLEKSDWHQVALSSSLSEFDLLSLARELKHYLSQKKFRFRYRMLKQTTESAGIGNDFNEVMVRNDGFYVLEAVQDIERWSLKDYKRPVVDPKSGMLPPKVARMLVNLALGEQLVAPTQRIFDPMCGSGTLLMEALDLGISAYGSDLSQKAVDDSRKNCAWFEQHFKPKGSWQVEKADIHHVEARQFSLPNFSAVAFEGYLGPADFVDTAVPQLAKGLMKLYLGAFKQLDNQLIEGGRMVMALPYFTQARSHAYLDRFVDRICKSGYNLQVDRVIYGREQARVKRAIIVINK